MRGADQYVLGFNKWDAPLPPRARGCHGHDDMARAALASTPACAGLPTPLSRVVWSRSLYPRVRGADQTLNREQAARMPLPPRARG